MSGGAVLVRACVRVFAALAVVAASVACAAGRGDRVHIRIHNEGTVDWQEVWLGSGGPSGRLHSYGAVKAGLTTPYAALDPVLASYRKTDVLVAPGRRFGNVVRPEEHVGTRELAPGRYTFSYRLRGEALVMAIHRDR